jgi:hypothetical protein
MCMYFSGMYHSTLLWVIHEDIWSLHFIITGTDLGSGSTILKLGTRWRGESSARPPGRFASCTHWIGGWLGPRASLHAVEKRELSCPAGNRNPVV